MRYFIAFLAAIGLIVLVFVLILRSLGGSDNTQTKVNLLSYANTNTVVRLSVDGPVSSNETHRAYRISVDRNEATMVTTIGYNGEQTSGKSYANNVNAFATFLRALDLQGFTKGDTSEARKDDRGYCPEGERYAYEIIRNGKTEQRFWSTSCGRGTYGGNAAMTRQLFQRQIPDFNQINNQYGPRAL